MPDFTEDEIKDAFRGLQMIEANIQNWKYIEANAPYIEPKRVADALTQVLELTAPMIEMLRGAIEIEALTKFGPIDLID